MTSISAGNENRFWEIYCEACFRIRMPSEDSQQSNGASCGTHQPRAYVLIPDALQSSPGTISPSIIFTRIAKAVGTDLITPRSCAELTILQRVTVGDDHLELRVSLCTGPKSARP